MAMKNVGAGNGPRFLNSNQLAERWGVTPQHIRNLVARGDLQGLRLGRIVRIPIAAVEEKEQA